MGPTTRRIWGKKQGTSQWGKKIAKILGPIKTILIPVIIRLGQRKKKTLLPYLDQRASYDEWPIGRYKKTADECGISMRFRGKRRYRLVEIASLGSFFFQALFLVLISFWWFTIWHQAGKITHCWKRWLDISDATEFKSEKQVCWFIFGSTVKMYNKWSYETRKPCQI